MKVLAVVAILLAIATAEKVRFDNYRVYSLNVQTLEQLDTLRLIEEYPDREGYNVWNHPNLNRTVDLMVSPEKLSHFEELVNQLEFEYKLKVQNVQELIDAETPPGTRQRIDPRLHDWTSYQTFEEIDAWLDEIIAANPNVLTNFLVGYTTEGRVIRAVKYSEGPNRPAVFLEANIHAREWITSATATWVLNNLVYGTDPDTRDLASSFDWYIIPVANPDGFSYTHTTYRLWRKTRSRLLTSTCIGTDPNRNFDFFWNQGGASDNPCSEVFAGPAPFSEPETVAIARFFRSVASTVHLYLSFHSYGPLLLFPYGHTSNESWNHQNLTTAGNLAATAISQRYGTQYNVGSIAVAIYIAAGGSIDWAFGIYNIPYTYTLEFRGGPGGGGGGFILPPEEIIPNSLEVWDGLIALIGYTRVNS